MLVVAILVIEIHLFKTMYEIPCKTLAHQFETEGKQFECTNYLGM